MEASDWIFQTAIISIVSVFYLIVFKRNSSKRNEYYRRQSWNYPFKLLYARYIVRSWKKKLEKSCPKQDPRTNLRDGLDSLTFRACGIDGTIILLSLRKLCGKQPLGEITVHIQLPDGASYKLARHPDTLVSEWERKNEWKAGGLKVEVLEAWERIRILYNGMLIRTDTNTVHHARLNLIWIGASKVVSYPEDWNSTSMAEALAVESWKEGKWANILNKINDGGNIQWSCVQGWFQIDEGSGTHGLKTWLRARGVYDRNWSPHGYKDLRRSVSLMITAKNGTAVHLRLHSYRDVLTKIYSGTVRLPNTVVEIIKSTDLVLEDFCESKDYIPPIYTIIVVTDTRVIKIIINIENKGFHTLSGLPYQQELYYRPIQGEIDGNVARGILELGYEISDTMEPSVKITPLPKLRWISQLDVNDLGFCADFQSTTAKCVHYVGGKGASLALLSSMQNVQGYKVPPGFCLTTKAFEHILNENSKIKTAITNIECCNENYIEDEFRSKCGIAVDLVNKAEIKGKLKGSILEHLEKLRKVAVERKVANDIRFAVRSSAVGEDSEALSAAGQNETVLGCISDEDVLNAILKCWASMFAFTSAHYRRQNGQPCMSGAAVVIQVLVSPRAAGVLFTRHPQSGDPSRLLITANYGLGESVVSGSVEPDTFTIARDLKDNLTIKSIELGSKKQLIVTNENGITTKEVSVQEQTAACLTNEEALKLAKVGIVQEEFWGAPRDIEWAINEDGIYLLQARPITSLENWSEEELLHELDYPIMSEEDLLTFANTGEVLPKPISTLGHSVTLVPLNIGISRLFGNSLNIFDCGVGITHYRGMLNMYTGLYRRMPEKLDITVRMMEMSIHGHAIADKRIHSIALSRYPPNLFTKVYGLWIMFKTLLLARIYVKHAIKCTKNITVDNFKSNDIKELLTAIKNTTPELELLAYSHCGTSSASSVSQIVTMGVLLERTQEFSNEHYNDLALMLNCGDTVSGEMPNAIERIARAIKSSGKTDQFKDLSPENGMAWLEENLPKIYEEAVEFLEKYGHRTVMEFDIRTVPWAIDPRGFISVLQNMHTAVDNKTQLSTMSDEDIIASLVTPKKPITRKILRWLLPLCRSMVSKRECTKAQLILCVHKTRLATRRLGEIMVKEWYLPSMELIFYFTLTELWNYIDTRDPALLRKAAQRRQYYPKWEKLKFTEMQEGWPEPIKVEGPRVLADGAKVQATPVCGGEVVARACVISDLSEIKQLQHGDILITHSTDIGWSPYFPLITGIVTELGGLISHGAVIARECGLPCIVGATGATDIFRTGDLVRLSGNTGLLEKVSTEPAQDKLNDIACDNT